MREGRGGRPTLSVTVQVPRGCSLCPLLPPLHHPGVAVRDGPGGQVPGPPQQQHQLHHLLPGWQPVQIGPPATLHLRRVRQPTREMIGLTKPTEADHDQITKINVRYISVYVYYYCCYYIGREQTPYFRKNMFGNSNSK